jgi:hypothetical protein
LTKPNCYVSWHHDLIPLILACGFELGFTGETAWRTDNKGVLWAVANVKNRALWYQYEKSLDGPSTRLGEMTRGMFEELFIKEAKA